LIQLLKPIEIQSFQWVFFFTCHTKLH